MPASTVYVGEEVVDVDNERFWLDGGGAMVGEREG